jgi:hypothetical protein
MGKKDIEENIWTNRVLPAIQVQTLNGLMEINSLSVKELT